ncbi:hypothetical protein FRC03_005489 [Tulasnella sp. 419]|nr:hypothetical protein FRC03_005489 [Tulasnella sp. 419]
MEEVFRSLMLETLGVCNRDSPFIKSEAQLGNNANKACQLVDHWWHLVTQSYAEPQRHYHTLAHVESMWSQLDAHREDTKSIEVYASSGHDPKAPEIEESACLSKIDVLAIRLAILFHDIVYDPSRGDNELKSIEVFKSFASDFQLVDGLATLVISFIQSTIKHALPDLPFPSSLPLFLDLDLEVLSRPTQLYKLYSKQISREYLPHMPLQQYLEGRIRVLQKLSQGDVYFTKKWKQNYSQVAKQNMQDEISLLSQQLDGLKDRDIRDGMEWRDW